MKPYYYGITKDGKKDISTGSENFEEYRTVCSNRDLVADKERVLEDVPFKAVLESLEQSIKKKVWETLSGGEDDDSCMSCIDIHNLD